MEQRRKRDNQDEAPMASVEIRPGIIMAYDDYCFAKPWTSPQTIVAVHGNAESARAWTCWVPFLAGQFRLVLPDMPGFGRSVAPPTYHWQVAEIAGDLGRFLDAAKIERCHLMGAKYGGSIATQFAIDHSDRLLSLSLFGSPVRGSGSGNADKIRDLGVRGWAEATQRARLGSNASDAQVAWWTDELMGKTDPRAAFGTSSARIGMELEERLSCITCPTLIVTTQESGLQSVAAVESYARRIADARLIVLPGDSYHIAASEPAVCAGHMLRFIADIWARSAAEAPAGTSSRKSSV
jgi:pimeloyl-ACP methyl ester carboxylesterase